MITLIPFMDYLTRGLKTQLITCHIVNNRDRVNQSKGWFINKDNLNWEYNLKNFMVYSINEHRQFERTLLSLPLWESSIN